MRRRKVRTKRRSPTGLELTVKRELLALHAEVAGMRRDLHGYYEALILRFGKLRMEQEANAEQDRAKERRYRLPLKGKT